MNGLPSLLCTDNLQDLLFSAPYDALFNANQATALFAFDDLRIFEVGIHHPDRLLRASPSGVRDRFFMTVGAFQDLGIRLPAITEKQRGFTITVPFCDFSWHVAEFFSHMLAVPLRLSLR